MDLIRTIRNEAAHNANPVSFDSSEISDRCKELRGSSPDKLRLETSTPREHFVAVVHAYSMALDWVFMTKVFDNTYINEEASEKPPQTPQILDWLGD
jgi:hypothetical protein